MEFAIDYAWLIPLLPLLGSLIIAAFARQLREPGAGYFGSAVMAVSFLLSVGVFGYAITHGGHEAAIYGAAAEGHALEPLRQWRLPVGGPLGGHSLNLGLMVDNLSAATLFMVTLVSLAVQVYSISYMHGDKRFTKYFAAVNLFTTGMLLAVMADNLLFLLIGWEIMGLCSYLLIGHWFENEVPQAASMKAFMTTRVGDTFMLLGIFGLYMLSGTLDFGELAEKLPELVREQPWWVAASALLLFGGPIGKSAQFPLHVWLPDAMAGPTPGSALIHAATMVAVGVYLVARGFTIFAAAGPGVMAVIALVGAFTSIFAASIATLRTDIKQVLAYSTVSQLGYMIMALGVGSFSAGTFHLMTHAFFKALLFLASGSVIHAVHTQEMHQMGGLRRKMPVTYLTWMVGYLALAGFPGFSGFFSKDELLLAAYNWPHMGAADLAWPEWVKWLPFVFGMGTAFLTAYYMTRATYLTFFGEPRDHHAYEHAHESPPLITVPLVVLAVFALLAGYAWAAIVYKWTGNEVFLFWEHFTEHPAQELPHEGAELVTAMATTLGLLGIATGIAVYKLASAEFRRRAIAALRPLYAVLKNKYYVDELYHATAVRGTLALGRLVGWFDRVVVDGIVNLVGDVGVALSDVGGWFDRVFVDGLVNGAGYAAMLAGRQFRRLATGQVQAYMTTFALVVIIGAIAAWWTFSGVGG
ncbi:NADH-quinone oxidoreductase subunit L [Caldinitratiruptor microaerophilus]|uniref:NADH-quinone oxidoreductase subunit L n=1 Tax=Caldinitratiruptor microaerophilus TaxID=671077 RepID=A0AA35CPC1_9FIRM|nr:NADH-quinone oxidoreductase subunit L [Caldinitratiruptor microaerophilus]BDG61226.1 NADH-quinone oxidoreductase subunit L [Caldinitratiruptor microaerophilus]